MRKCTEIKETLSGKISQFECDLLHYESGMGILQYKITGEWKVAGQMLPAGSFTDAIYWEDRPYNLYWFQDAENNTLSFYFNIADSVQLSPGIFRWRDLAVDILITAEGRVQVLDEDELPSDISPALIQYINNAKQHILTRYPRIIDEAKQEISRYL